MVDGKASYKLRIPATLLGTGLVGSIIGALAWPTLPALSLLALIGWSISPNRRTAYILMLGYYLGAARGIPAGAGEFFGGHSGFIVGYGFWLFSSVLLSLPWIILLPARSRHPSAFTMAGLALGLFASIVPPLGLFGWVNPVFGVLALGWQAGLLALFFVAVLSHAIARSIKRDASVSIVPPLGLFGWVNPVAVLTSGLLVLSLVCVAATSMLDRYTPYIVHYTAINTRVGMLPNTINGVYSREVQLSSLVLSHAKVLSHANDKASIVLPESVAGVWEAGTQWVWRSDIAGTAKYGSTQYIGAIVGSGSSGRADVVLKISAGKVQVLKVDQIPVPVSMWHPWAQHHNYKLHLLRSPVVNGVAIDICYEQLLPWTTLSILVGQPHIIIGMANDWWSVGTSIPAIQRVSLAILGRLAGVPVVDAVNT